MEAEMKYIYTIYNGREILSSGGTTATARSSSAYTDIRMWLDRDDSNLSRQL